MSENQGLPTQAAQLEKLCFLLHEQALEPAEQEAARILDHAQQEGAEIIAKARKEAASIIEKAQQHAKIETQRLEGAFKQACSCAVSRLRAMIEQELFRKEIKAGARKLLSQQELLREIVQVYLEDLRHQGILGDFILKLPAHLSAKEVAEIVGEEIVSALGEERFLACLPGAGVTLMLKDHHLSVECSDEVLEAFLLDLIGHELREHFFHQS